MADAIWRGDAPAIAQVKTAALSGAWANADEAVFTINQKNVTVTLTTEANNYSSILNTFATSLNASTIAEFQEITWANLSDSDIQGTADTAGKPFTATNSETTAGSGALADFSVVTENEGPYSANTAANWSTNATPTNSDAVIFEASNVDCKWDLDALSGIDCGSITVKQSYTGKIGLPRTNVDGGIADSAKYVEYRERYLQLGAATTDIGEGEGTGSGRLMLDLLADDSVMTVYGKGSRAETGIPCVLLKGTNASNSLTTFKSDVGVAFFAGETSNLSGGLKIAYTDSKLGDSMVVCGDGLTLATVTQSGGKLEIEDNTTTFTQDDGEATIRGAATITTLTMDGTIYHYSTGTITTLDVTANGDFDHGKSMAAATITNVNLHPGAKYRDPNGVLTETNNIDLERCTIQEVTVEKPAHKTIAFTSI